MKIKNIILSILFILPLHVFGQEAGTDPNFTEYEDKVPGTLLLEFGFNMLQSGTPSNMDIGLFNSRSINVYYMYDFRLFGSKLVSFNPGFGIGMDNFMFEKDITAGIVNDTMRVANIRDIVGNQTLNVNKSKISANYLDIPMEIRFRTKPTKNALRVAVGGKVGFLFDSKTKVKYENGGETIKLKEKSDLGLAAFRYGLHFRLGYGSLNLFAYYSLSDLVDAPILDANNNNLEGNFRNVIVGVNLVTF